VKQVLILDSQLLNNFQDCEAKFYYNFVRNIRPPVKPEALDKGDLVHYILKFHYRLIKHNQMNCNHGTIKQIPYSKIIEICIAKAEKYLLSLDLEVDQANEVVKTYGQYAEYYKNCNWSILEVEKPFAKVLYDSDDLKIIYVGIIDLLTSIAIVDTKSSSRRGEPSALSNQFMGYAWAFNVFNVVINKVGFQKTLKPEEKFERYTKSYPKAIIDEWQANAITIGLKVLNFLQDVTKMTRNFTSCDKYAGCVFQQICQTVPDAREFVIERNYQLVSEWKPTKGLEI